MLMQKQRHPNVALFVSVASKSNAAVAVSPQNWSETVDTQLFVEYINISLRISRTSTPT